MTNGEPMRVLIACEFSGVEREAFRALGHDAMSCDLLPADDDSPHHYQGDVCDLMGERWDLVIAHPPCTILANSGVRWLYERGTRVKVPDRWHELGEAAAFFRLMFEFNTPRLAVENPIQHKWAKLAHGMGEPTQYIQPYEFGHLETKRTGLWLRGLPPLVPSNDVREVMADLPAAERNRIHYASPGPDRWKLRSTSYAGIAEAMADQWATRVALPLGVGGAKQ